MNEKVEVGIFPNTLTRLVLAHAMHGIFSNDLQAREKWSAKTWDKEKGIGFREVSNTSVPSLIARNVQIDAKDVSFEVIKRQ